MAEKRFEQNFWWLSIFFSLNAQRKILQPSIKVIDKEYEKNDEHPLYYEQEDTSKVLHIFYEMFLGLI